MYPIVMPYDTVKRSYEHSIKLKRSRSHQNVVSDSEIRMAAH